MVVAPGYDGMPEVLADDEPLLSVDELLLSDEAADEALLSDAADEVAAELSDEFDVDPPEQAVMANAARMATSEVVSERI
jgi:hypothetical protein